MSVTGTANLDRNRAFVSATGTGPNGETTVAIPAFIQVDADGDPVTAGGGDASAANQVITNAALGAPADAAWASGSGTIIAILKGLVGKFIVGAGTAAAATRVTYASDGATIPVALTGDIVSAEYERVAASATDQALGATGATGDFLSHLVIVPATAAAGAVSIKDGAGSSMSVFAGGGTTALPTLAPIIVAFGVRSLAGAWSVTTGTNVSVFAVGNFT